VSVFSKSASALKRLEKNIFLKSLISVPRLKGFFRFFLSKIIMISAPIVEKRHNNDQSKD
jgi:hypothetical protein